MSELSIVRTLWLLSSHFYMTCSQMRRLFCEVLVSQEARCEAIVSLFNRCVDWALNSNVCRSKLAPEIWDTCKRRCGSVPMFCFFQPENFSDVVDWRQHEERVLSHTILTLWSQENISNMRNNCVDW